MSFEMACEVAMEYFKREQGDTGLVSALDIGDGWVFDGDNEKHETVYGKQSVAINKTNGECSIFYLPNDKNFELLENANTLDIPKMYQV